MGDYARRAILAIVVVGAMTAVVCPAAAQTSGDHDVAVAEFREARRLIDANDCASALLHLERSLAREPSVGARMSMAECQEKTDAVKAWRSLAEASLFAYTNHDDRLPQVEARMGQLERRAGTFHLGLAPADLVRAGLDVRIDGRPVDRFLLRRGIVAVEPGEHTVEASAPDRGTFTWKGSAPVPGASVLVPIEIPAKPPAPPPPTIGPSTREPSPPKPIHVANAIESPPRVRRDDAWTTRRAVGFTIGAVGIVGIAVGTAFGIVAFGRASDLDDACGGDRSRCQVPASSVASIRESASTAAAASTVSLVVGGAALATGAVLVLWGPSRPEQPKTSSSGALHLTAAGVAWEGSF